MARSVLTERHLPICAASEDTGFQSDDRCGKVNMPKWPQDQRRAMRRRRMILRVRAIGLLVVSAVLFATSVSSQDATDTWRGLVVAPEHRCSPYDRKRDYPYPAVHRAGHRAPPGRCIRAVHGYLLRVDPADGHRAPRGDERGARLGPVCQGPRDAGAFRLRPPQPDTGVPAGEPPPKERQGRRRVAAGPQTAAGSPPAWWKFAELTISPSTAARRWRSSGFSPVATAPTWSRWRARHRARTQRPSRLPVHAGWRRGGLRVSPVDRGLAPDCRRPLTAARRPLDSCIRTDTGSPYASPPRQSRTSRSEPMRPLSGNGGAA